ncbi:MAG: YjbQ family protein [Coriobacteriaceae bacterium]|nr:YjbQ family protein [Coriobacteriaceae bacterium]MCI6547721.1 YjbQ family protein [Coriobacteriaceae bacterium]MCI6843445.1 YjbQ family protein [Coriobacteriaceae bacterium]MCI7438347.1 YjbQ family protein [Coriobacteriaceae bacterium]MDD7583233.1 YjbQ family protein [Coriobacteriaceae bacterium]
MAIYKDRVVVETLADKPTYVDVTDEVRGIVEASGIKEGVVFCISQHTTCAVFTEEFDHDLNPSGDTFLQVDLNNGLERVFPEQHDWATYNYPGLRHFEEVESWPNIEAYLPGGDRRYLWNGDGHLRSTLIGSSVTLEVEGGKLQMNGLASVFFVDYDRTRERTRKLRVIVMGE